MFFYTDTADARTIKVGRQEARATELHDAFPVAPALSEQDHSIVRTPDPLIVGSTDHVIGHDRGIVKASIQVNAVKRR